MGKGFDKRAESGQRQRLLSVWANQQLKSMIIGWLDIQPNVWASQLRDCGMVRLNFETRMEKNCRTESRSFLVKNGIVSYHLRLCSCNVVVSFLLKNTCNCFQSQVSSVSFSRKKLIQNGHRVSIRCFLCSCAIRSRGKINNAESNAQCADSSSYSSCCFFV